MAEMLNSIQVVAVSLCKGSNSKGMWSTYFTRKLSESYLFMNRSTPSHNSVTTRNIVNLPI